jgi:hypothetical protein
VFGLGRPVSPTDIIFGWVAAGRIRSDSAVRPSPLMSDNATTSAVAARGRLQTSRDPISNQACEVMRAEG